MQKLFWDQFVTAQFCPPLCRIHWVLRSVCAHAISREQVNMKANTSCVHATCCFLLLCSYFHSPCSYWYAILLECKWQDLGAHVYLSVIPLIWDAVMWYDRNIVLSFCFTEGWVTSVSLLVIRWTDGCFISHELTSDLFHVAFILYDLFLLYRGLLNKKGVFLFACLIISPPCPWSFFFYLHVDSWCCLWW